MKKKILKKNKIKLHANMVDKIHAQINTDKKTTATDSQI